MARSRSKQYGGGDQAVGVHPTRILLGLWTFVATAALIVLSVICGIHMKLLLQLVESNTFRIIVEGEEVEHVYPSNIRLVKSSLSKINLLYVFLTLFSNGAALVVAYSAFNPTQLTLNPMGLTLFIFYALAVVGSVGVSYVLLFKIHGSCGTLEEDKKFRMLIKTQE